MASNTDLDTSATPQTSNTPQQEKNPLAVEVYTILKDLQDAKRDFEGFYASQRDNFQKIGSQLDAIEKAKIRAITLIDKETKTYKIILAIWWVIFVGAILSFFILPIIGFILLCILSQDIVLEKFSNFFASWLTYLSAGIGLILLGGFQNLYRRINLLQKEIDRIKNINSSDN